MQAIKKAAQVLTLLLDGVIATFFTAIILITILQVILRYVFNSSILIGSEAMEALFIYTTAVGAAVAVRRRQHISIDFMVKLLPAGLKKISDMLVHLLIGFLNGVMIYYSIDWISKVGNNESPVMRVPEWIFQISIPVGCSLVILYCLINIILIFAPDQPTEGDPSC